MPAPRIAITVTLPPGASDEEARREMNRAWARHVAAAVSEGLCPHHGASLDPVPASDGSIAGYCATCHYYWRITGDEWSWDLGYDPHTGQPAHPRVGSAARDLKPRGPYCQARGRGDTAGVRSGRDLQRGQRPDDPLGVADAGPAPGPFAPWGGVKPSNLDTGMQVTALSTPAMFVQVASGTAYVPATISTNSGYICHNSGARQCVIAAAARPIRGSTSSWRTSTTPLMIRGR